MPNDHDLLVRLDTKMDTLGGQIAEVKASLDKKAESGRVDKLEDAVEQIRSKIYYATGGLAVLQVVLRWAIH